MIDDFDEDTLISSEINSDVIGPIAELRRKKEIENNTFVISREMFEKSSNEQVEAWFTKFDQVIIDDSENPYKDPLTKKEAAIKVGSFLYHNLNRENVQKGIGMIQKGTDMISEFGNAFGTDNKQSFKPSKRKIKESDYSALTKKPKRNSLMIWSEEKKHQIKPKRRRKTKVKKEYNPFKSENKITFASNKKVKFF
jgi:hypothetical protein